MRKENYSYKGLEMSPDELISPGKYIPEYIFTRKFKNYLLFDQDILTSGILVYALQKIVNSFPNKESNCRVYSSCKFSFVGYLDIHNGWEEQIFILNKK